MSEYLEVNLEEVDLSFKLPPVGDYIGAIENYEFVYNDDGSLKNVQFNFILTDGMQDGIGMKVRCNHDPNHDVGKKMLKMMAIACDVPFDSQKIYLEPFIGKKCGLKIVHKPGRDKETMFANIAKFFIPEMPGIPGV